MAPEPEQPERPIEKLLRACAKKKREQSGEGWELHPATRRLLQQEVARRWRGKPATSSPWLGWLLGHGWLRPLLALGGLASVLIATWIWLPAPASRKTSQLLAKNEPPNELRQSQSAAGSSGSAARQVQLKRTDAQNREEDATRLLADNDTRKKQETASLQQREMAKDYSKALDRPAAVQPLRTAQNGPATQESGLSTEEIKEKNVTTLDTAASAPPPQNYGLGGGLQPAPSAPAAAAAPEVESLGRSRSAILSAAPNARALPLSASADAEGRLLNLGGASRDNTPNTGVVHYGYFAASQQPVGNARNFQFPLQNQKGRATTQAEIPDAGQTAGQILASFRVEQAGPQLRIIDSDGSVYAGPIQASNGPFPAASTADQTRLAETPRAATALATTTGASDLKAIQQTPAQYFFQVKGTNRSSNQRVIFSGTLDGGTNLLEMIAGNIVQPNERSDKLTATPTSSSVQTLRLSGKVVIGEDQAVQLEAVPSPQQPRP